MKFPRMHISKLNKGIVMGNMIRVFCVYTVLVCVLCLACAGTPAANTGGQAADSQVTDSQAAKARESSAAALDAMNRGGSSGAPAAVSADRQPAPAASASASSPSTNRSGSSGGPEPAWVASPDSVFDRRNYIAAVGYGSERVTAEKNAFANLTALFGQSIQGELAVVTRYSEAVVNGVVSASENTDASNAIKTSVELKSLVGAEIRDYWYDGKSVHYAAAVMERAKTALLYKDMIRSNENIIAGLITMTNAEKNTFNGYSRYRLAGTIADANRTFANVLYIVGAEGTGIDIGSMKKGDDYRLEAANITGNIPIQISVTGDKADRIRGAFASALNSQGFKSGGKNSRYTLDTSVVLSPVELPNQQNKFVRYTIEARLIDSTTGGVLFPYNINGREGHTSSPEAENRAIAAAERKINGEYGKLLASYLDSLLPAAK
jgi:hypothetical protein